MNIAFCIFYLLCLLNIGIRWLTWPSVDFRIRSGCLVNTQQDYHSEPTVNRGGLGLGLRWIRINIEHPDHVSIGIGSYVFIILYYTLYSKIEILIIIFWLILSLTFPIYILKRRCIHLVLFIFKMCFKLLEYLFLYYITHDKQVSRKEFKFRK